MQKKKLHLFNSEAVYLKRKESRKCKCESTKTYSNWDAVQELQALWETFKTIQLCI